MIADRRWDRAIVGLLLCLSIVAVWNQAALGETKGEEYYRTGEKYLLGQGVPEDYVEAAKWFRKADEQSHALAQGELGAMYYVGAGVSQDDAEAVRLFRKAAEQGVAQAQDALRTRGLSWTAQSPEQDVSQEQMRKLAAPPPTQRSRSASSPGRPAAKKQTPAPTRAPKIPDDLGDLD
jgi:TPR repeat protein